MNKQEVIELALSCGLGDKDLSDSDYLVTDYGNSTDGVIRFADAVSKLARSDEREKCAKQLDALGCDHCAAAIRRGQK